jgi:NAD+ synthase
MKGHMPFTADQLTLDSCREAERVSSAIREQVFKQLRRKGVVVGLSGGIDSSVVAALSVQALGADRVLGLFMPEADSSDDSLRLGQLLADSLGIKAITENISPILQGAGCYRRRDEAIKAVIPQYNESFKSKIILPSILDGTGYRIFSVVVEAPDGTQTKARLSAASYLGVVAATNFKQRVRKMMEYYHADRLNYAVAGTPNRLEYDQGFFVKNGDGAADFKPIAHLYKTQVYQLAAYLNVPLEIQQRPPTTDTYSLQQSQEEFYFSLPYDKMDLCLFGKDHGVPSVEIARVTGLTPEQVDLVSRDIDAKRRASEYLHHPPLLVEQVKQ